MQEGERKRRRGLGDGGRGGRGTFGPSLGPPLPQDTQNSQAPAEPHRSSRSCPPARPLDPGKAVKPSQSLSRGVRSGLPKPCSPRGAGSTAAWRPQTHHLPRRDSLTGSGLPRLRPGAAPAARSSPRVPPLRLPRPLGPRSQLWAYGTSSLRANVVPEASPCRALQTVGTGPRRSLVSPPLARPLRPSPRAPGLELRGLGSSLRPARENPRVHSPRPLDASPAGRRSSPAGPRNPRPPEAEAWERGRAVTWPTTGSKSPGARARTRTQNAEPQLQRMPEVRAPGPAPGSRTNSKTLFPRTLRAMKLGNLLNVSTSSGGEAMLC